MPTVYSDTPHNMSAILPYVVVDKDVIVRAIIERQKCFFYDTCSFRRHCNLQPEEAAYILKYFAGQDGTVIITRCILMELASHSGILNPQYIDYIKRIKEFGITVLVFYEEDLFSLMSMAFASNSVINSYLCWSVRMVRGPVSTITEALEQNAVIYDEIIKGKSQDDRSIYQRFFEMVRGNKESGDHLGEELLAICLHILSYLPGEEDGKFCIITDDKEAAGKIDHLFRKTAEQYKGKQIIIFSTPKLVQVLHREKILEDRAHIKALLSTGTDGNIVVLGTRIFDIRSGDISLNSEELADLIVQPNGIHIIF